MIAFGRPHTKNSSGKLFIMIKRIIARIDIKNESVIKGIHLEGLRKVGDPNELALKYFNQGIDELIFMDAVAAYYDRNSLFGVIQKACEDIFVPLTVGGGIRNLADIQTALDSGADKVAINTIAIKSPDFLTEASRHFGSQCIVSSITAKKHGPGHWEAYFDNGREPSGLDAIEWAQRCEQLGAGEILVTSIDNEGTKKGFDIELVNKISCKTSIPVIACGGAGKNEQIIELFKKTPASGTAVASLLHYNISTPERIKSALNDANIEVRI